MGGVSPDYELFHFLLGPFQVVIDIGAELEAFSAEITSFRIEHGYPPLLFENVI